MLRHLQAQGICEILILSGEVHPQSVQRTQWIRHIQRLCELALSMGFLPHTNVGPLTWAEMQSLQQVNASMGLMLEQVTPHLHVHQAAPSKDPALRLAQLQQAGQLHIPFTTGLLLGIGETEADRVDTLQAIAKVHQQYGHIQEVIIQPHRPDPNQAKIFPWQLPDQELDSILIETVKQARDRLPSEITIQIPPNLTASTMQCLEAGARDLGGLGPKDHVNPDYPHPTPYRLQTLLQPRYHLHPRLPVYPQFYDWIPPVVRPILEQWLQDLAHI